MQNDEPEVGVHIDCNRSRVELTAAEGTRHDVTVAVANLTPTSSDVSRSTVGAVEGNDTVEFTGEGLVFAFARNQSDDVAASDVTRCAADAEQPTTTEHSADSELEARINCTESTVRFVAGEETNYVGKTVAVDLSPTGTSTSSSTQTLEGNATVSVAENALVAAFASTGELGDDRTISVVRNCSPYGNERLSANETDTEDATETDTEDATETDTEDATETDTEDATETDTEGSA